MLAPVASLVARENLHPALVDILIEAAKEVHRNGDIFTPTDRFPATDHLDFPLSSEALRYLTAGPSFLQRYLPFWGANLLDRIGRSAHPGTHLADPDAQASYLPLSTGTPDAGSAGIMAS